MSTTTRPTARLRALLADEFADDDAPAISTALLLLNIRTGKEELRLFARAEDGHPGHEICVWKSEDDHGPFALDMIEAIHSHRLRHWRPEADAFVLGIISTTTNRPTGQIGWSVNDLDTEAEAGA
ncbi:hypothetical protein [Streptomyces sp. H27-C3]|uniref:hypothetical protein n=1 Tax=Streptomyces sp. H27-C3 TaxID=3046305 RepID=UPI0024BAE0AE|nr:hypothetical protein [Streptomyces sp. H27-C3]MDJ0465068.1 hypothetical protein [Streptomyces sp. H27-C3]